MNQIKGKGKVSKRIISNDDESSSSSSSSESEVEYEPIIVEDEDGRKLVLEGESNPLAPLPSKDSNLTKELSKSASIRIGADSLDKKLLRKRKLSKVFASRDNMLAMIESVNVVQDEKIKVKMDRDVTYLQRQAHIEKMGKEKKSMKGERLDKIKDNLRKGGIRVKGENRKKVQSIRTKQEAGRAAASTKTRPTTFKKPTAGKPGKGGAKKSVKFADEH